MVAAYPLSPDSPPSNEEPRILLPNVPWATYVILRDTVEHASARMTYCRGWLEIMSPSKTHEINKKQIARLLELFCLERDIPLYGYGSTTFRKEETERGLEPDECYCRARDGALPDVALEVEITKPAIDKLEVYRGLGVREVWIFRGNSFSLFALRGEQYEPLYASEVFPEVNLARLAHYAVQPDQHAALLTFRQELRGERPAL